MPLVPPEAGEPELSVVMVSYGARSLTERAIAALLEHTARDLELILVDNGSDAATRAALSAVPGARLIVNERNVGFGPAANQGAAQARGRFLVLLNTDAFVHPGWFEPLAAALEFDRVGAVVPCLLHEDGSLQEAGMVVARDGTVRVYGDGDDPARACYRFRRFVDLGSAACMVLRRECFERLGGFDPAFAPAYYEDADFCLHLAEQGLRVVYEPRSTVTHVRYGSGGSDRAVELSERNRALFSARWGSRLVGRPWTFVAAGDQAVTIARDAGATPRILICAPTDDATAAGLGDAALALWPAARVTWATGASAPETAGNPWIELADQSDAEWLGQRLFHYDLVVSSQHAPEFERMVGRTQPQAARIALGELGEVSVPGVQSLFSRAGIA